MKQILVYVQMRTVDHSFFSFWFIFCLFVYGFLYGCKLLTPLSRPLQHANETFALSPNE